MDAKLIVIGGNANRGEVKLKLPTIIGRGRDAGLTIAHPTVSRHHCEITEVDGALVVRDNGSTNGTFIGSEKITGETLLRPGDELTVGPLTFRAEYKHKGSYPRLGRDDGGIADTAELGIHIADRSEEPEVTTDFESPVEEEPAAEQFNFGKAKAPAAADDDLDFELNVGESESAPAKHPAADHDTSDFLEAEPPPPKKRAAKEVPEAIEEADEAPVTSLPAVEFTDDPLDEPAAALVDDTEEPAPAADEPTAAATADDEAMAMDFLADLASVAPAKKAAEKEKKADEKALKKEKEIEQPPQVEAHESPVAAADDDQLMNFLGGLAASEPPASGPAESEAELPPASVDEAAVADEAPKDFAPLDEAEPSLPIDAAAPASDVEPADEAPAEEMQVMDFLDEPSSPGTAGAPVVEPSDASNEEAAEALQPGMFDSNMAFAAESPAPAAADDDQLMAFLGDLGKGSPVAKEPEAEAVPEVAPEVDDLPDAFEPAEAPEETAEVAEEPDDAFAEFVDEAAVAPAPADDDLAATMQFQSESSDEEPAAESAADDQPDFGFLGATGEAAAESLAEAAAEGEGDDVGFMFTSDASEEAAEASTVQFDRKATKDPEKAASEPATKAKPEKKGFSWWPFGKKKPADKSAKPAAAKPAAKPEPAKPKKKAKSDFVVAPAASPEPEFDFAAKEEAAALPDDPAAISDEMAETADEPFELAFSEAAPEPIEPEAAEMELAESELAEPEAVEQEAVEPEAAEAEPEAKEEAPLFANFEPAAEAPAADPSSAKKSPAPAAESEDEDLNSFFKQMGMK